MKQPRHLVSFVALAMSSMLLIACSTSPGQPKQASEAPAPGDVMDFSTLYSQNCAGCHGAEGRGGPSIALADPVYLEIVNRNELREVVANGVRGTSMPAFAQHAGGMLSEQQIDVITSGMFSGWRRKGILDGGNPPSYAAKTAGDVDRGKVAFETYCASCHGSEGGGTPKGSAIADGSFLALVSNQGLRTIVITGRPELGAPDWRADVPGKPMSELEITDVVAWLASRRVKSPGQPYSASNYAEHAEH